MIAQMWEVRVDEEHKDALLDWVFETALPAVETAPSFREHEVWASRDRVVVITKWTQDPQSLPDPPPSLVARPPHAWDFTSVQR
ncbi:MAG TPA: antibiotic biosynthesis monooxygenase [Candidatus Stackebrandtia faecavium]|nr:antibiotic biosynthesis monooxygenase [Candidatus Stackebrandtia faecavium]